MNPNAKEFVPAHLLKKRQDEAVGEITAQIGGVAIDETERKDGVNSQENGLTNNRKPETGDSTAQAANTCSRGETRDEAQENLQNNSSPKETEDGAPQAQHNPTSNHHNRSPQSNNNVQHHKTNGDSRPDPDDDDRHLLRAGENYCEFNGEQFIIPGEDDEYTSSSQDYQHPGYDFGNAEDNEDEDVCNAYDEFLRDLPQ